jgi:hypothetical protein
VKCAFAASLEKTRIAQPLQVVTERRRRKVDMTLDLACRRPAFSRLHDEPQDTQAHGMTQRAELLGMSIQFGGHGYF